MRAFSFVPVLLLFLATSCSMVGSSDPSSDEQSLATPATATVYMDMDDFEVNTFDQWLGIKAALKQGFDNKCGDVWCESDYANLSSMQFSCSVTSKEGRIHSCVWVFAGSFEQVNAKTGEVVVTAKTWTCPIPMGATATAAQLMKTLDPTVNTAVSPIDRALPGTTATAYDAINNGTCLP